MTRLKKLINYVESEGPFATGTCYLIFLGFILTIFSLNFDRIDWAVSAKHAVDDNQAASVLEYYFNRYQTFITGICAILVGYSAYKVGSRQAKAAQISTESILRQLQLERVRHSQEMLVIINKSYYLINKILETHEIYRNKSWEYTEIDLCVAKFILDINHSKDELESARIIIDTVPKIFEMHSNHFEEMNLLSTKIKSYFDDIYDSGYALIYIEYVHSHNFFNVNKRQRQLKFLNEQIIEHQWDAFSLSKRMFHNMYFIPTNLRPNEYICTDHMEGHKELKYLKETKNAHLAIVRNALYEGVRQI